MEMPRDKLVEKRDRLHEKLQIIEAEIARNENLGVFADKAAKFLEMSEKESLEKFKQLKPYAEVALFTMILTDICMALADASSSCLMKPANPLVRSLSCDFLRMFKTRIHDFSYWYIVRYCIEKSEGS